MHQVSKPRSANHSITEECGRPDTSRSKVGCEAIEEPCTKKRVPFGAPAAEGLCHRKSLTSPLRVQCSVPFIPGGPWRRIGRAPYFKAFYARIRPLEGRRAGRSRGGGPFGHVSQAAHAPRARARRAPGDPGEGSWHLADLDLAAVRRRGARAGGRACGGGLQARRPL